MLVAIAVVGIVLYCAGVPLFFVWSIRRYARDKEARHKQMRVAWLTSGYRPEQRLFEAVEMVRRLILTSVRRT